MYDEYLVFTGRPNAGKSSIIKRVLGLKIATGKRPGTTRNISKYPLTSGLILVDMPGFGRMTGVSLNLENMRKNRIIRFLEIHSQNIALAIHVLDISTFSEVTWRLEKKGIISVDVEMVQFLVKIMGNYPLVAANKIDKRNKMEIKANIEKFMHQVSIGLPMELRDHIFLVSARTGEGLGSLKREIHERLVNRGFKTPFKKQ